MTLLAIDQLSVSLNIRREQRQVLRQVSLELRAGETLALVGESGSGKSMTARSVLRLLPRHADVSGSVRFDGEDVLSMSKTALRRYRSHDVAAIFQDPHVHLNPVRSIGDFLVEGLVTNGKVRRSEAERTMVHLLGEVGIADGSRRLRQYPHELSGGLLQRVMIAAAIVGGPRLLLADEPTTALDVSTQADVAALLEDLCLERGMAMLFITHDLELASAICDRMAVMYAGEIVESNTCDGLLDRPRHPYSAGLLAARPDIDNVQPRLRAIPGRPLAAFEAPTGCAFATRCAHRETACEQTHPALEASNGPDAEVRCFRSSELQLSSHIPDGHEAVTS